jgi:hypothetical protein
MAVDQPHNFFSAEHQGNKSNNYDECYGLFLISFKPGFLLDIIQFHKPAHIIRWKGGGNPEPIIQQKLWQNHYFLKTPARIAAGLGKERPHPPALGAGGWGIEGRYGRMGSGFASAGCKTLISSPGRR